MTVCSFIKKGIEEDPEKLPKGEKRDGLDIDEGMLMAGLSMFENTF